MHYLDTSAIIHLKDKGLTPSPAQKSKLYISMLGIQELLKNIQDRIKDDKKRQQTLTALRWIHDNKINIHWKSVYQAQADAFDYNLNDPLTKRIQALYEAIISSDDSMVASIVEAHTETIMENEEFLRIFYGDIRTDVNKTYRDNSYLIQNHSKKEREKMKELYETSDLFDTPNKQMEEMFYKQGIKNELACLLVKTDIPEEDYQGLLNNYSGTCDAHIRCLTRFGQNHSIGGPIEYNDMTDLSHTYYLYNKTCKIISDDETLLSLVRQALGRDRFAMTTGEYLSNQSDK